MKWKNNSNSQEKDKMRHSNLPFQWHISSAEVMSDRSTCLKIVPATRASILRHVRLNDTYCRLHIPQENGNFECLILAFSWDLELFFSFIQRYSRCEPFCDIVWINLVIGEENYDIYFQRCSKFFSVEISLSLRWFSMIWMYWLLFIDGWERTTIRYITFALVELHNKF
jgi:hypothetical protein